jgi:hypothetical protein
MRFTDTTNADTANAIAAFLNGFQSGKSGVEESQRKDEEAKFMNAYRGAATENLNQENAPLSGDVFNQAFQQQGINSNLPAQLPNRLGNTYTGLLGHLKQAKEAAQLKKEQDKQRQETRKALRERESKLETTITGLRGKLYSAQTNLLSNANDPNAIATLTGIKGQIDYSERMLKAIRAQGAAAGLPEYQGMSEDATPVPDTSGAPVALPGMPTAAPSGAMGASTPDVSALMQQLGR